MTFRAHSRIALDTPSTVSAAVVAPDSPVSAPPSLSTARLLARPEVDAESLDPRADALGGGDRIRDRAGRSLADVDNGTAGRGQEHLALRHLLQRGNGADLVDPRGQLRTAQAVNGP